MQDSFTTNPILGILYRNLESLLREFYSLSDINAYRVTRFEDPKIQLLNFLTLGELSILNCYTNNTRTSFFYLLAYLKNCQDLTHFSVSGFLESLITNLENLSFKEKNHDEKLTTLITSIGEACFSHLEQNLSLSNPQNPFPLNDIEHPTFLILNLFFKIENEDGIIKIMNRINALKANLPAPHQACKFDPHSFQNFDMKFNANLIYPSEQKFYLISRFCNNSLGWLTFSMKQAGLADTSDFKVKLASALLALNLNYESQIIWNYIARLLYDSGNKTMAYQCMNMGKVFSMDDEQETVQHGIALWYKIMIDVNTFEGQGEKDAMLAHIVQNIRGVGIKDNLYVMNLNRNLIAAQKKVYGANPENRMGLEQLGARIASLLEKFKLEVLLKAINLYL